MKGVWGTKILWHRSHGSGGGGGLKERVSLPMGGGRGD